MKTQITKSRPVLSVVTTLPISELSKATAAPNYLGKRPNPNVPNSNEVHVWSDNTELYTIGYHPEAGNILFYVYNTDQIEPQNLSKLNQFISTYIKEPIVPANGFINVSHTFIANSDELTRSGLFGAIIAPAEFIIRPDIGINRSRCSYTFNMSHKPYMINLNTIHESTNVIIEFMLSYIPNNVINFHNTIEDMISTLKSELSVFENKLVQRLNEVKSNAYATS